MSWYGGVLGPYPSGREPRGRGGGGRGGVCRMREREPMGHERLHVNPPAGREVEDLRKVLEPASERPEDLDFPEHEPARVDRDGPLCISDHDDAPTGPYGLNRRGNRGRLSDSLYRHAGPSRGPSNHLSQV